MADIVKDFYHGPASFPSVSPEPQRGSGWIDPVPMRISEHSKYVDMLLDDADRNEKIAKLTDEPRRLQTLAEARDAEVARLEAERVRLE